MPTALSSTDSPSRPRSEFAWWRPVRDVGYLLQFRAAAVRRRSAFRWSALLLLLITVAVSIIPAYVPADDNRRLEVAVLMPTAMAGIFAISIISAIASGGGRELVAREQGVAFPISPTTDHLGALVLAPLNISWLIQAWVLLGLTAYGLGTTDLLAAQIGMLVWIAAATAVGQVVAWTVEAVRRSHHGIAVIRTVGVALAAVAVTLQLTGRIGSTLGLAKLRITATTDRRAALKGADFVILMMQIGGYKPATVIDFEIPKRFGVRQTIADTLGIGGIFRTLRTIPVVLDIARQVHGRHSADAKFTFDVVPSTKYRGQMLERFQILRMRRGF